MAGNMALRQDSLVTDGRSFCEEAPTCDEAPTLTLRPFPALMRASFRPADAGPKLKGQVAQLVEHMTENHGVGSSILPLATK
jgi:hypothetical protein